MISTTCAGKPNLKLTYKPSASMRERVIVVVLSVCLSRSDFGEY